MSAELVCGHCGKAGQFSDVVSVVLAFVPGLARPYPLIPAEDYRVCSACDAVFRFIDKAVAANPNTRSAGLWTRAVVVFVDGSGFDVKAIRKTQEVARA